MSVKVEYKKPENPPVVITISVDFDADKLRRRIEDGDAINFVAESFQKAINSNRLHDQLYGGQI